MGWRTLPSPLRRAIPGTGQSKGLRYWRGGCDRVEETRAMRLTIPLTRFVVPTLYLVLASSLSGQDEAATNANANNPLADIKTFSVQNYQFSRLYGVDETANTLWLRGAIPTGRVLWRGSLPFQTVPIGTDRYESGLGDFNMFGAYLLKQDPKLNIGVGPNLTIPTAGNDALGAGKWQAGLTGVLFAVPNPVFQMGALVSWQGSFAGDDDREGTNLFAFQPFLFWQVGGGWYLRNSAIWVFNWQRGDYNVPLGVGAGKVIPMGSIVFNVYAEGQFTVLHEGTGQPATQIFLGFNTQFLGDR